MLLFFTSLRLLLPPQRFKFETIRGPSHQDRVRSHRARVPHTSEGTTIEHKHKKEINQEVDKPSLFVLAAAEPGLLFSESSGAQAASALRGCRGRALHDADRRPLIQRE